MYICHSIIPCGLYAYNQLSTVMKPEIFFVVKIPVSQLASCGDHSVVLSIPIEAQLDLSMVELLCHPAKYILLHSYSSHVKYWPSIYFFPASDIYDRSNDYKVQMSCDLSICLVRYYMLLCMP